MEEVKEVEVTEEALKWDSNVFNKLFNMDVTPHVDSIKTGSANLKYLSWATAYQLLIHQDPKAIVEIVTDADGFPLFTRGNLHFVKTAVTAFGMRKECWLPVMDYKHNAVTNPNARQINDSTMRCLAKNIALFGIGLKLYTGDDLEQYKEVGSVQEEPITQEQLNQINGLSKEKKIEFIKINEYCKTNFKSPLNKITKVQGVAIIEMLKNTPDPQ